MADLPVPPSDRLHNLFLELAGNSFLYTSERVFLQKRVAHIPPCRRDER